jgi:hypothetical protein
LVALVELHGVLTATLSFLVTFPGVVTVKVSWFRNGDALVDGHLLTGESVDVATTLKPGTDVVVVAKVVELTQSCCTAAFAASAEFRSRWSAVTRSRLAF